MEGMKLLQEILGHHRRAHWQKRATDGEKLEAGMKETSGCHFAVLALPLSPELLLTLWGSVVIAATSQAHLSLLKTWCWQ